MNKAVPAILCVALLIIIYAGAAHTGNISFSGYFGGSNIIREYEEYMEFGITYGATFYYSFSSYFQIGCRLGFNRWAPQERPFGHGVFLDWTGSAKLYEIVPMIRFTTDHAMNKVFGLFLQTGTGIYVFDSNAKQITTIIYPGSPTYAWHIIESQTQPGLSAGGGLTGKITINWTFEFLFQYNYVFTDNKTISNLAYHMWKEMSTEYYTFSFGLMYRL